MWVLDHKECWAQKNWCFWTVVLEKTFESPLDWKKVKLANPKGSQPWIFIVKTDAEAEAAILGESTHWKKPWCWEWLKAEGEGEGRGWDGWMASPNEWMWVWVNSRSWWWTGSPGMLRFMGWGRKESDMTEWLNWTVNILKNFLKCWWKLIPTTNSSTMFYFLLSLLCSLICFHPSKWSRRGGIIGQLGILLAGKDLMIGSGLRERKLILFETQRNHLHR